ncbi:MAG: glycosyltransferase family 39 protein [Acidobacteria bacterium]|nr:glycosyltransferase family 39 protein [Acidobacteriota bacterium]MCA1611421.1 glycosyltransferase family 39 protein [Acidobacteriota bacterium]
MLPSSSRRFPAGAVWLLALVTGAMRLPGLRDLPVFGDEAIHVHWSQLVREDPGRFAFVSMQDPKPPLHFWLVALALPWASDPIRAGRLVSVFFGALSIAPLFAVVLEIRRRFRTPDASAAHAALAACVLAMFCPFAAFSQRLALAESLFLCESLLAVLLALRIAVGAPRATGLRDAAFFGVALGLAMLTRQNFSYALWAFPALSFGCLAPAERCAPREFLTRLALAGVVALLLWGPLLLQPTGPEWRVRVFHVGAFRQPLSWASRAGNAVSIASWLWTYLTPPLLLLCLVGLVHLLVSRNLRVFAFLTGWMAIVTGPLVLFASVLFSRYAFTVSAPLWVAGGCLAAWVLARARRPETAPLLRRAVFVLAAALLVWPARDLYRQAKDWRSSPLSPPDRWQYVTGWPAGFATEQALAWLRGRASATPLVLVTPDVSGNPGDTAQVLLRGESRIARYAAPNAVTGEVLVAAPDLPGAFLLSGDLRKMEPPAAVRLPAGRPVYFLAPDPFLTRNGWRPAREFFGAANPGIDAVARFENPAGTSGDHEAIVIFRLK